MKLVTWNVNSLRNAEPKFLEYIQNAQPDIVMIQELRAFQNQLSFFLQMIPGYSAIFNPSGRAGYGGTAWYCKKELSLDSLVYGCDDYVLDSEGRTIYKQLRNTHIINFYTPNGNMNQERLNYKLKFYDHMKQLTHKLLSSGNGLIIAGDLNVAHTEKDLYNPKAAAGMSGFLPTERQWFSDMLDLGMFDAFRHFEKSGGYYTWWNLRDPTRTQNRGWRFDYFLISSNLMDKVKSCTIRRDVYGSDHCPVELEIII